MTRSKYFWLLLIAGGIGSYPLFVRGNDNAQSELAREGRNQPGGDVKHQQGDAGADRETRIYRVSAYCCCAQCTSPELAAVSVESGRRRTASGYRITESDYGRICAAPPDIRFGSRIVCEGEFDLTVQDRGGVIQRAGTRLIGKNGKPYTLDHDRIDILMGSHSEALAYGIKYLKCEIVKGD